MPKKVIKVYVSEHCKPCHEITELLHSGRFEADIGEDVQVDLIDIETEEGFNRLTEERFNRLTDEITSIPAARYNGKKCSISIDREFNAVYLSCEVEGNQTSTESDKDKS